MWRHYISEKNKAPALISCSCSMCTSITANKDLSYVVECCLRQAGALRGGWVYRSEVMHRELLLGAPEQVQPRRNREERMTCRDSFGYAEAREQRVGVNEGGVVVVRGADTGL